MKKLGVAIFAFIWATFAYAQGQNSVESLLNQAEDALNGQMKSGKDKAKVKRTKTVDPIEKKKAKKKSLPEKEKNAEAKDKSLILQSFPDSVLKDLVQIKTEESKNDKKLEMSTKDFSLGLVMNSISDTYELDKDDDTFTLLGRALLVGINVSYRVLLFSDYYKKNPYGVSVIADLSYLRGHAKVHRQGIESYSDTYLYQQIPVDLSLVASTYISNQLSFMLGAGYSMEALRQEGSGQYDSVSAFARGGLVSFIAQYDYEEDRFLRFTYKQRGIMKDRSISGRMFVFSFVFPSGS